MGIKLTEIKAYFGYETLADFSRDWKGLPEHDREQIKSGIEDGSLTYA